MASCAMDPGVVFAFDMDLNAFAAMGSMAGGEDEDTGI